MSNYFLSEGRERNENKECREKVEINNDCK
jgi:hypothetical protein